MLRLFFHFIICVHTSDSNLLYIGIVAFWNRLVVVAQYVNV